MADANVERFVTALLLWLAIWLLIVLMEIRHQRVPGVDLPRPRGAPPRQAAVCIPGRAAAPQRYALNPDNGLMYESERGPWVRAADVSGVEGRS